MVEIGSPEIQDFLQRLRVRYLGVSSLYPRRGCALCLLVSAQREYKNFLLWSRVVTAI